MRYKILFLAFLLCWATASSSSSSASSLPSQPNESPPMVSDGKGKNDGGGGGSGADDNKHTTNVFEINQGQTDDDDDERQKQIIASGTKSVASTATYVTTSTSSSTSGGDSAASKPSAARKAEVTSFGYNQQQNIVPSDGVNSITSKPIPPTFVYKAVVPKQEEERLTGPPGNEKFKDDANDNDSERDGASSKKIIGSSVVTSVSVILNGDEPEFADALGHKVPKPQPSLQVASPIDLLNPDRYEFYTFDDNGELVKRLMTMQEIQSIVANGDGEGPTIIHPAPIDEHDPEGNVQDIVQNVQTVLNAQVETKKNTTMETLPVLDTPDVSSSWSMILPAIFGNTGGDIFPQLKPQQVFMTPDADLLETSTKAALLATKKPKPNKRKPGQKRKTTTTTTTRATTTTEMTPQVVQEDLDPHESVYTGMEQYQNAASNMQHFEGLPELNLKPFYQEVPDSNSPTSQDATTKRVFVNNQEMIQTASVMPTTTTTTTTTTTNQPELNNEYLGKKPIGGHNKHQPPHRHKTPNGGPAAHGSGTKRPQVTHTKQKIKKKPTTTTTTTTEEPETTTTTPSPPTTIAPTISTTQKKKKKKPSRRPGTHPSTHSTSVAHDELNNTHHVRPQLHGEKRKPTHKPQTTQITHPIHQRPTPTHPIHQKPVPTHTIHQRPKPPHNSHPIHQAPNDVPTQPQHPIHHKPFGNDSPISSPTQHQHPLYHKPTSIHHTPTDSPISSPTQSQHPLHQKPIPTHITHQHNKHPGYYDQTAESSTPNKVNHHKRPRPQKRKPPTTTTTTTTTSTTTTTEAPLIATHHKDGLVLPEYPGLPAEMYVEHSHLLDQLIGESSSLTTTTTKTTTASQPLAYPMPAYDANKPILPIADYNDEMKLKKQPLLSLSMLQKHQQQQQHQQQQLDHQNQQKYPLLEVTEEPIPQIIGEDLNTLMSFDQLMHSLTDDESSKQEEAQQNPSMVINNEPINKPILPVKYDSAETVDKLEEMAEKKKKPVKVNETPIVATAVSPLAAQYGGSTLATMLAGEEEGMTGRPNIADETSTESSSTEETTLVQSDEENTPVVIITQRPVYYATTRKPEELKPTTTEETKTEETPTTTETFDYTKPFETTTITPNYDDEILTTQEPKEDKQAQVVKIETLYVEDKDPVIIEITTETPIPSTTMKYAEDTTMVNDETSTEPNMESETVYTTQAFLRLPVSVPQKVEHLIAEDDGSMETTVGVADLKPHLNLEVLKPSEQISMSDFQTQAATVASTLVDGTNTIAADISMSSNETKDELQFLMSDVLEQVVNPEQYKILPPPQESHQQAPEVETSANRLTNFAQLNTSFLMMKPSYQPLSSYNQEPSSQSSKPNHQPMSSYNQESSSEVNYQTSTSSLIESSPLSSLQTNNQQLSSMNSYGEETSTLPLKSSHQSINSMNSYDKESFYSSTEASPSNAETDESSSTSSKPINQSTISSSVNSSDQEFASTLKKPEDVTENIASETISSTEQYERTTEYPLALETTTLIPSREELIKIEEDYLNTMTDHEEERVVEELPMKDEVQTTNSPPIPSLSQIYAQQQQDEDEVEPLFEREQTTHIPEDSNDENINMDMESTTENVSIDKTQRIPSQIDDSNETKQVETESPTFSMLESSPESTTISSESNSFEQNSDSIVNISDQHQMESKPNTDAIPAKSGGESTKDSMSSVEKQSLEQIYATMLNEADTPSSDDSEKSHQQDEVETMQQNQQKDKIYDSMTETEEETKEKQATEQVTEQIKATEKDDAEQFTEKATEQSDIVEKEDPTKESGENPPIYPPFMNLGQSFSSTSNEDALSTSDDELTEPPKYEQPTPSYIVNTETSEELIKDFISSIYETTELHETPEEAYIKLGESTEKPSEKADELQSEESSNKTSSSTEESTEKYEMPISPETTENQEINMQQQILNLNEPAIEMPMMNYNQEADEEDDQDQTNYGENNLSSSTSTTTTTSTTSTTSTTTTTRKPSTTKRVNTLKPVSYYKQPSFSIYNQNEAPKPITYTASSSQPRPMQRPAALSNLMATSTQATRPPVKLEPSPEYSKGLEASVAHLDEDVLAFARLCNELAFSYWKSITSEKISSARSLVLSPFALTSMLSMVFLGARGGTSGEMNEVLKLDDMVTFNPHLVFKNITDSVERSSDSDIATAAFVREIFSDRNNGKILQFFKEKTQQFYAGHVEEVNFHVVNDIIRRRTNLLIKRHTMGKVLEYLRTNSVWVNGPLATISANLFQTDCSKASTHERDGEMFFQVHPTVRQRRLVPIPAVLYKSGFTAGYEPKLDATIVAFGRIQNTVSTIYVMPGHQSSISPTDNLERLQSDLVELAFKDNAWSNLLTALMDRPGMEVQLPRFSHRSFVNASLGLQKMGLKGLFKSDYADLRGLTGSSNRDIYLSDMIQINTFSTCGEERISDHHHVEMYPAPPLRKRNKDVDAREDDEYDSSEAIIDFGSLVQEPTVGRGFYDDLLDPKYLELPLPLRPRQARVPDAPRLRFDKPFLYFVRHNPTGMILFMGRFNPRLLP